jgi:hypothetical protein
MTTSLDFETQLHTVPVRNEKLVLCGSSHNPDALVVEVELRYRGVVRGLASFVRSRNRKRYELVGLSRELFERLDGTLTVEDLIDDLMVGDQLTFFEARALVMQYLKDLMQRGLVVIIPDVAQEDGCCG